MCAPVNTRRWEGLAKPLIVMGDTSRLHVRADVDESEAWRIRAGASAQAAARGDGSRKVQLEFVRFEPYVTPKKSLTGDSTERVDTRVLQVIYRFKDPDVPFRVGQQMDVFIAADQQRGSYEISYLCHCHRLIAARGPRSQSESPNAAGARRGRGASRPLAASPPPLCCPQPGRRTATPAFVAASLKDSIGGHDDKCSPPHPFDGLNRPYGGN